MLKGSADIKVICE